MKSHRNPKQYMIPNNRCRESMGKRRATRIPKLGELSPPRLQGAPATRTGRREPVEKQDSAESARASGPLCRSLSVLCPPLRDRGSEENPTLSAPGRTPSWTQAFGHQWIIQNLRFTLQHSVIGKWAKCSSCSIWGTFLKKRERKKLGNFQYRALITTPTIFQLARQVIIILPARVDQSGCTAPFFWRHTLFVGRDITPSSERAMTILFLRNVSVFPPWLLQGHVYLCMYRAYIWYDHDSQMSSMSRVHTPGISTFLNGKQSDNW